jgi:Phage protein (N4 Gp49/phage Sf6 gene 66) family
MPSDQEIEQEIQRKGLNAPRVTPAQIESVIAKRQYHVFEGSQLTVCCLTLTNGFTVTGESACASPENFNADLGEKIALQKAKDKIRALEGYLLKQRLFEGRAQA